MPSLADAVAAHPEALHEAVRALPTSVKACVARALDEAGPTGRSVLLALIRTGSSSVVEALATHLASLLKDEERALEIFAALEEIGRSEGLKAAVDALPEDTLIKCVWRARP